MMYLLMALMMALSPTLAQSDDCGDGLPCGPVPWTIPRLPVILSPTPIPTTAIQPTNTPEPTQTPDPGHTATPEPEATLDPDDLDDLVGDVDEIINRTPIAPMTDPDGNPLGWDSVGTLSTGGLWGYLRGLIGVDLGVFQPVLVAGVIALFVRVFVKSSTLILPVIAFLVGGVRKAVEFVLKFIPGLG